MKSFINAAQAACLALYAQGDFEHLLHAESEEAFVEGCNQSGDGLLRFLMVELSTREDCESLTDALQRTQQAIDDLQAVHRNIEAVLDRLSDTHVRLTLSTRLGRTGQQVIGSKDNMVWDDPDGDDETVSATFEVFRMLKMGEPEIIETASITGDQWREVESEGDIESIKTMVHNGLLLERAISKALDKATEPA